MSENTPSSRPHFPNLYALLKLAPLESSRNKIEAALRRMAAHAQSLPAGDRQAVRQLNRLIELGQQNLLDEQRKQRYDRQWQAVFGGSASAAIRAESKMPAALQALLPQGDPSEPFEIDAFLARSAATSDLDAECEYAKIAALLSNVGERHNRGPTPAVDFPAGDPKPRRTHAATAAASPVATQTHAPTAAIAAPLVGIRQRRKQRERWLIWGTIGILALVATPLGLFLTILRWQPSQSDPAGKDSIRAQTAVATERDDRSLETPPTVRSGLPSVTGLAPDAVIDRPVSPMRPKVDSSHESTLDNDMLQIAESTVATPSTPVSGNAQPMSTNMNVQTLQPTAMPTTATVYADLATLSDADRAAWLGAVERVLELLGEQNYDEARRQLAEMQPLVKAEQQESQLKRLFVIQQLAQEFSLAFRQAIDGLSAGETITLESSTLVSFVAAEGNNVTLRIRGQNKSYSLTTIPIGIAFGLAELKMSRDDPRAMARMAAFALVHPGAAGNDLARQRAKQLMAEAVAAGVVADDLVQVFEDDYHLTTPPPTNEL